MSGIQVIGSGAQFPLNTMEVESGTKAGRITSRPLDYGVDGIYKLGFNSNGNMTAGLAAGSPIFSFRWPSAGICLIKKVWLSACTAATGFTAGTGKFDLLIARSWTVADTGGTDLTPNTLFGGPDQHRLRQNMGVTGVVGTGNIRISSGGTLTAGTRTLDAQPVASVACMCSATAGTPMVPPNTPLWDARAAEHPIALAQNEGIVIQATVTATGVWWFTVTVKWAELVAY